MKTKGYHRSNLACRSTNGRPEVRLLPWLGSTEAEHRGCLGHRLEGAKARATGRQMRRCFFLRNLGDEGNPICPLTAVEMTERKPTMRKRLRRPSTAVGTVSGDAPAPRTPPVVAVYMGAPPPLVWWINDGGWLGGSGSVLGQIRTGRLLCLGVFRYNPRRQKS
jgi:hypothetical protein